MNNLYELLNKNGLNTQQKIFHQILGNYSINSILKLNEKIQHAIEDTEIQNYDFKLYNFMANSVMSAQHNSCPELQCRLKRIKELAVFAALYCDTLFIGNYFDDIPNLLKVKKIDTRHETMFKYAFASDLLILLELKPLIDKGTIKLIKRHIHLCLQCVKKLSLFTISNKLNNIVNKYASKYVKECNTILIKKDRMGPYYQISGPEQLLEDGGVVRILPTIPSWLSKKLNLRTSNLNEESYKLTKREMRKVKIPDAELESIAFDLFYRHLYSVELNANYLTNRELDIQILSELSACPQFQTFNKVINNNFFLNVPFVHNIPIETLVKLRDSEYEAFQVFRNRIAQFINEYIKQNIPLSNKEAKKIYSDLIYPELIKLNAKFKSIKRSQLFKSLKNLIITSGVLSFGLISGLLPSNIKDLWSAVGGVHLSRELIDLFASIVGTPDEIKSHNMFFLWKVSKKSPKHLMNSRSL